MDAFPTEIVAMFEELTPLFGWVFKGLLAFILLMSLFEIIKQGYNLLRARL